MQGLLVAVGLLAGLALSSSIAAKVHVDPDRVWNLGLIGLAVFFLGERLLVVVCNLRDFLAHPFWMLGLVTIRDERYADGATALALCAAAAYVEAWRLPWRRILDALAPGTCLWLALSEAGSFAAGSGAGKAAAHAANSPAGLPMLALAPLAAVLYLAAGTVALLLVLRVRPQGLAASAALFLGGLGTVLLRDLRPLQPQDFLLPWSLTSGQTLGAAAVLAAGFLWLTRPDKSDEAA